MKWIAQTIAWFFSLAYLLWYGLLILAMGRRRAFGTLIEEISRFPGWGGIYIRQAFYRRVLAGIGEDVYVGFLSLVTKPGTRIGDRVYIGRFCVIGLCDIEDDVMFADGVQVLSGRHQHGQTAPEGGTLRDNEPKYDRVRIGKGAWLGAGSIVMADVGPGAVVGAGAVVSKPVSPGGRVGGVPARPLGQAGDARAFT